MIKLQIRRKTAKVWQHFITDGENFIFSKCYCKTNGDKFRVVEDGGTAKNEYNFDEIEVYDDLNGGSAETFTSSLLLMERLSALQYVGFNQDGNVVIADLISSDSSNALVEGTDGRLYVPESSGGAETFLELTDTPSTYVGQAGKAVVVNDDEDAVEFVEFPSGGTSKRTFTIAFSGGVYYDTSSIVNWSGMAINGTSSLGLNGHTNGLLFIYNIGSVGLPNALSSARVIPYDCKIKSIAVRNSSSPFSAVNPSAFKLRFYTHTPSGTSTLNNAILQAEFNSTGYLMLQNYTYPDVCLTNNGLTLQKGDVFTIIHKREQTLTANTAVHDILIEFEEEI